MIFRSKRQVSAYLQFRLEDLISNSLKRKVIVDLFLPDSYLHTRKRYPFLILNDGQDADQLRLRSTLSRLARQQQIGEVLVFAIHAGDRMQEYGVASQPDFKKRGSKAKQYLKFVIEEFLPLISSEFRIDLNSGKNAIAGFSLGGLSAFDIGWHYPELFQRIGVFSGSLWWRSLGYDEGFDEKKHRILHNIVRESLSFSSEQKFWFQAGTHDETADRNHNGIIDSIDDTLDLITELVKKGYRPFHDIHYHEIKNGKHNQHTWGKAMPEFLKWLGE